MKKAIICFLVAAMLMMNLAMVTSAAEPNTNQSQTIQLQTYEATSATYSLNIEDGVLEFIQNKKVVSSESMDNTDVTLTTSSDKGIAIQFTGDDGLRKITLGSQTSLTLNGDINLLTLSSSLPSSSKITIGSNCYVKKMDVNSSGKITVNGSVNNMSITNSKARVTASADDSIERVTTVSRNTVDGLSSKRVSLKNSSSTSLNTNSNGSTYDNGYYYNGRYYSNYDDYYYAKNGNYYYDPGYTYNDGYYYNNNHYSNYDDYYYARFGKDYNTSSDYYKDGQYYFDGSAYSTYNDYFYAKYGITYDESRSPEYYGDGIYRKFYADKSYSESYYGNGRDIFVSVVKLNSDNDTITFRCDVSGADIYWNDEFIGTTNNGNNEFDVDVNSTNKMVVQKNGYRGRTVTVRAN